MATMAAKAAAIDPRTRGFLSKAVTALKESRYQDAEEYANAAIEQNPRTAPAYHLLGTIAHQRGQLAEAQRWFKRVLEIDSSNVATHRQLGALNARLGKMREAMQHYRNAIALDHDNPTLLTELGAIEEAAGELDEAVDNYQRALKLDPKSDKASAGLERIDNRLRPPPIRTENERLHAQAKIALKRGDLDRAARVFRTALDREPEDIDSYIGLGSIALRKGDAIGGINLLGQAVELAPMHTHARNNLAVALLMQGRLDDAEKHLLELVETDPSYAEAYNNLGIIRLAHRQLDLAINNFRQALSINPDYSQARHSLAITLFKLARIPEAIGELERLISDGRDNGQTWLDLGAARYRDGDITGAIEAFDVILSHEPDNADAHTRRGQCLMMLGDYLDGWRELEWRWRVSADGRPNAPTYASVLPRSHDWTKTELPEGRRVLVYAERGSADNIQFLRYLPTLMKTNEVSLWAPAQLSELIQRNELAHRVHDAEQAPELSSYDCHLPLMRLARLSDTQPQTIPTPAAYLKPNLTSASHWKNRLKLDSHAFKVGLYWGDPAATNGDIYDLCPVEALDPLWAVAEIGTRQQAIQFVALQDDDDLPTNAEIRVADLREESWDSCAALIANLDLVISVNGLYAHLAAALGKPTWTLLAPTADWRWGQSGRDAAWYPTMTLWRRAKIDDNSLSWHASWEALTTEVATALNHFKTNRG